LQVRGAKVLPNWLMQIGHGSPLAQHLVGGFGRVISCSRTRPPEPFRSAYIPLNKLDHLPQFDTLQPTIDGDACIDVFSHRHPGVEHRPRSFCLSFFLLDTLSITNGAISFTVKPSSHLSVQNITCLPSPN
jgi:hypothetical protein